MRIRLTMRCRNCPKQNRLTTWCSMLRPLPTRRPTTMPVSTSSATTGLGAIHPTSPRRLPISFRTRKSSGCGGGGCPGGVHGVRQAVSDGPAFSCAPSFRMQRRSALFVEPVILSEAKNLSPGMHPGRSAIPSPIRRGFRALEERSRKNDHSRGRPSASGPRFAPQNDELLGV